MNRFKYTTRKVLGLMALLLSGGLIANADDLPDPEIYPMTYSSSNPASVLKSFDKIVLTYPEDLIITAEWPEEVTTSYYGIRLRYSSGGTQYVNLIPVTTIEKNVITCDLTKLTDVELPVNVTISLQVENLALKDQYGNTNKAISKNFRYDPDYVANLTKTYVSSNPPHGISGVSTSLQNVEVYADGWSVTSLDQSTPLTYGYDPSQTPSSYPNTISSAEVKDGKIYISISDEELTEFGWYGVNFPAKSISYLNADGVIGTNNSEFQLFWKLAGYTLIFEDSEVQANVGSWVNYNGLPGFTIYGEDIKLIGEIGNIILEANPEFYNGTDTTVPVHAYGASYEEVTNPDTQQAGIKVTFDVAYSAPNELCYLIIPANTFSIGGENVTQVITTQIAVFEDFPAIPNVDPEPETTFTYFPSTVSVYWEDYIALNQYGSEKKPVTMTCPDGSQLEIPWNIVNITEEASEDTPDIQNSRKSYLELIFTPSKYTESGEYKLDLPSAIVYSPDYGGSDFVRTGFTNQAYSWTYTLDYVAPEVPVPDPLILPEITVDPEQGAVSVLSTITLYWEGCTMEPIEGADEITLDINRLPLVSGMEIEYQTTILTDGIEQTLMIINLASDYGYGEYVITIPANYLLITDGESEATNPEITLTYNVDPSTGLTNLNPEEGNVTIYTLTGVKVANGQKVPEGLKGLYIINGKKVLIKD